MIRTLRLALVAVAVVAVAGVAFAGPNCNKSATASSSCSSTTSAVQAQAQSADCAATCAAAGKTCTPAQQAACAEKAKMAQAGSGCAAGEAAMADCSYCDLIQNLHANAGKVKLSAQETDEGVVIVFAAVSKGDVETAHAVAAKAYDMMSKPAACAVTKAKMASTSCDGCQKGLDAFAKSKVTMEETADGNKAMVSAKDEKTVEQIHAFFRNLTAHANQG